MTCLIPLVVCINDIYDTAVGPLKKDPPVSAQCRQRKLEGPLKSAVPKMKTSDVRHQAGWDQEAEMSRLPLH